MTQHARPEHVVIVDADNSTTMTYWRNQLPGPEVLVQHLRGLLVDPTRFGHLDRMAATGPRAVLVATLIGYHHPGRTASLP